mgnify:CR=1 FL=1
MEVIPAIQMLQYTTTMITRNTSTPTILLCLNAQLIKVFKLAQVSLAILLRVQDCLEAEYFFIVFIVYLNSKTVSGISVAT